MHELIVAFLLLRVFATSIIDRTVCVFIVFWAVVFHAWATIFHVTDIPVFLRDAAVLICAGSCVFFTGDVLAALRRVSRFRVERYTGALRRRSP